MDTPRDSLRLLVVDDEPDMILIARIHFEAAGWQVYGAGDVTSAKTSLGSLAFDAVLSDLVMRGGGGLELLAWAKVNLVPLPPFYLLTACLDNVAQLALEGGAKSVFAKPCDWQMVVASMAVEACQG